MAKKRPPYSFNNDSAWQNRSQSRSLYQLKKQVLHANTFLYPIDESEEFYDPFSDLSLFLAKKITKIISSGTLPKQWSGKVQELLLEKILPEFEKRFPKYRLGGSALKKTFDKVLFYYQKMQAEKHAFQSDGSIDVEYIIKENLRNAPPTSSLYGVHPYNYSHQLAVKVSECIATLDGIRIPLDQLTKTIWSAQKHLLPKQDLVKKAPFEHHEIIDKLIIRNLLHNTCLEKEISQRLLMERIIQSIKDYEELSIYKSIEDLKVVIASVLSDLVIKNLSIFRQLSSKKIDVMESFIVKQIKRCKEQKGRLTKENKASIVSRILSLYPIAASLPREDAKQQLDGAIQYVYSLSSNIFAPTSPMMNHAMLSFINTEIVSLKEKKETGALEKVLSTLLTVFQDAHELPKLNDKQISELEAWIWHLINLTDQSSHKIPKKVKELIENELSHLIVEKEVFCFRELVQEALLFFKRINELEYFKNFFVFNQETKIEEKLKNKAYLWSIQNDLVCSILEFDHHSHLIKETEKALASNEYKNLSSLIETVCQNYMRAFPFLSSFSHHLQVHVCIIVKYVWYNHKRTDKESSYHRFLKWHMNRLIESTLPLDEQGLIDHLATLSMHTLPLIPFDPECIKNIHHVAAIAT
ncbi:MAG: hypothetical protein HY860_03290 [Chlamydiales bacterium]|nr:hypothetical protein [Chlamydiales bacterium]